MTRYTRRQLYAVVSDVASYPSYFPFCTHSRVLGPPTPTTPNAEQMEVELTVAFLTFTERYTSLVTCVPCESVRVCPFFFCLPLVIKTNNFFCQILTFVELGANGSFFFLRGDGGPGRCVFQHDSVRHTRDNVAFSTCADGPE